MTDGLPVRPGRGPARSTQRRSLMDGVTVRITIGGPAGRGRGGRSADRLGPGSRVRVWGGRSPGGRRGGDRVRVPGGGQPGGPGVRPPGDPAGPAFDGTAPPVGGRGRPVRRSPGTVHGLVDGRFAALPVPGPRERGPDPDGGGRGGHARRLGAGLERPLVAGSVQGGGAGRPAGGRAPEIPPLAMLEPTTDWTLHVDRAVWRCGGSEPGFHDLLGTAARRRNWSAAAGGAASVRRACRPGSLTTGFGRCGSGRPSTFGNTRTRRKGSRYGNDTW